MGRFFPGEHTLDILCFPANMETECELPEVSLIDTEVTPGTVQEYKECKGILETLATSFMIKGGTLAVLAPATAVLAAIIY